MQQLRQTGADLCILDLVFKGCDLLYRLAAILLAACGPKVITSVVGAAALDIYS